MTDPLELLQRSRTLAVVGLSQRPWKAAHAIPRDLQEQGWRIIPVHPTADQLLGEKVHPRLADIPEDVDLVVVFRPSSEAADVVSQAVEAGMPAVWLQLGIRSEEARAIAEEAGIAYVEDACTGALALSHGLRPEAV